MSIPSSPVAPMATGYQLPSYASVIPDAVRQGRPERLPLVIVGGGLTGLTLATDLAMRGFSPVLLDEDNTIGVRGASSRGMVYAQKSLEVMAGLGFVNRIVEKGVTWSVGRTLSGEETVYGFDRAETNVSAQPAFVNLQQFYLEWFLVDRFLEIGAGELRWHNKVTGIESCADGVLLEVSTPEGSYTVEAGWVVDATGANSQIREMLSTPMSADRHVDRWCICDIRCKEMSIPERWTWVDAPFNEGRAVWQHMMADDVWRLDYQLAPTTSAAEAASLETATARVREHLGRDAQFELVWVGPWQYRNQLLHNFRYGRTLFAGDAAHVMSPFGARGGNSGIQDANNLGWKLALVLSGKAQPELLDSYDAERRPAAEENIRVTSRTARFLAPRSPFETELRTTVLDLARELPFARSLVNTGRLSLPNSYAASPILAEGGGECLPNVRLVTSGGERTTLMELLHSLGTASLGLYAPRPGRDPSRAAIAGIGGEGLPYAVRTIDIGQGAERCAFSDPHGTLATLLGLQPGEAVIVRPDAYCAGRLRDPSPVALEKLLARSVGFAGYV